MAGELYNVDLEALAQTHEVVKYRLACAVVLPMCQHNMIAMSEGSAIMAEVQRVFGEQFPSSAFPP